MSLSFIGALVALLPPALLRPKTSPEVERLREDERRARELSNAHAALAIEKLVSAHWKEEAKRLAITLREEREAWESEREQLRRVAHDWQVRALPPNMRGAQQLQAHQAQIMNAQAQAQQAQLQQYSALANQFQNGAFCNCVPGRSQVFLAEQNQRPTT